MLSEFETLSIFSGAAPQTVLKRRAQDFACAFDCHPAFTFRLVSEILEKLAAGEKADLIFLPVPLIAEVEKTVPLLTVGRIDLARVGIGVVVRDGTNPPKISTMEVVRKLLLDARAIALDDPATPNGIHLNHMMARLGIADAVQSKLIEKAPIEGGAELVARGEADVGLFLVSEVLGVNGITMVGILPTVLQNFIVYGCAIPAYNRAPELAQAFVDFVSDPATKKNWEANGFQLVGSDSGCTNESR